MKFCANLAEMQKRNVDCKLLRYDVISNKSVWIRWFRKFVFTWSRTNLNTLGRLLQPCVTPLTAHRLSVSLIILIQNKVTLVRFEGVRKCVTKKRVPMLRRWWTASTKCLFLEPHQITQRQPAKASNPVFWWVLIFVFISTPIKKYYEWISKFCAGDGDHLSMARDKSFKNFDSSTHKFYINFIIIYHLVESKTKNISSIMGFESARLACQFQVVGWF